MAVVARECVEQVALQPVDAIRALSAGRSSHAWIAQVGEARWIARIPIVDSGRRATYRAEMAIGRYLTSLGHPVADWTIVDAHGTLCSVARALPGLPVEYGLVWSIDFGRQLAGLLADVHAMRAEHFGPLVDNQTSLRGVAQDRLQGIVDRWCHAPIWPFDASKIDSHPIFKQAPEIGHAVASLANCIEAAATGPTGVVHSDLHREHLLTDTRGLLTGVLDFGDAFIGSVAWDFALLNWYYGEANASLVACHHPAGAEMLDQGAMLSVAVGLYKAAKNPNDPAVIQRLQRCLASVAAL